MTKAILKHLHIKVHIFPASPLKASVSLAAFQLNFLQVTHFLAFMIMVGGLFEDEIADFLYIYKTRAPGEYWGYQKLQKTKTTKTGKQKHLL